MKMSFTTGLNTVLVQVISQIVAEDGSEQDNVIAEKEFNLDDIPAALKDGDKEKSLAAYGLTKLLQDRTSQITDKQEKFDAMVKYFEDFFSQGLWKAPSEGSARKAAVDPVFAEAVANLKGWSIAQAVSTIQALDKDQRAALRGSEKVQAAMTQIKEEMANVNVEDLLGDLGVAPAEDSGLGEEAEDAA